VRKGETGSAGTLTEAQRAEGEVQGSRFKVQSSRVWEAWSLEARGHANKGVKVRRSEGHNLERPDTLLPLDR